MIAVFAVVVVLSIRPVRNMLSPAQMTNFSFNPLHLVNTLGVYFPDGHAPGERRRERTVHTGQGADRRPSLTLTIEIMETHTLAVLRRGVEAAIVASVPQVILPKIEERLLLPRGRGDLGPHLIEAVAARADKDLPEDVKWLAASAFHFGYASLWGVLYALARERWKMRPWIGGLGMAALIHLITFPSWGAAVQIGSEPPPRHRTWRSEIVFLTAPLVFGLRTALLYGEGPRRCEEQ